MLDVSLQVLEACSDSFFLALPSADLWDFFLFFTRILYIRSMGLGRGTPASSLQEKEERFVRAAEEPGLWQFLRELVVQDTPVSSLSPGKMKWILHKRQCQRSVKQGYWGHLGRKMLYEVSAVITKISISSEMRVKVLKWQLWGSIALKRSQFTLSGQSLHHKWCLGHQELTIRLRGLMWGVRQDWDPRKHPHPVWWGGTKALTGYFSRGSISRASPKISLQYSAILACCLGLEGGKESNESHWPSEWQQQCSTQ